MTDDPLALRKKELRARVKALRKAAAVATPDGAARATAHFLRHVPVQPGQIASGYFAIQNEIDATPLMTELRNRGLRVCAPVIEGRGQPLLFREWTPDAAMVEGAFGAMIPAEGDYLEPTLLITPLIAFDRQGWRLGYGGGFYDRTLEGLRARRPTLAVAFAYAAQEVPEVPIEPTDQRLDAVVTETGIMWISSDANSVL